MSFFVISPLTYLIHYLDVTFIISRQDVERGLSRLYPIATIRRHTVTDADLIISRIALPNNRLLIVQHYSQRVVQIPDRSLSYDAVYDFTHVKRPTYVSR